MRNFFPFMTAGPEISGLRADLIYANYIIACLLPLFVIFLCIRMVSSTKKAGVLTVILAAVFVLFNRDVRTGPEIRFVAGSGDGAVFVIRYSIFAVPYNNKKELPDPWNFASRQRRPYSGQPLLIY